MPRLVIALGLTALLWATAVRTTPLSSTVITSPSPGGGGPGTSAGAVDGNSHRPSDSEQQWRNAHHAIAVVTESHWKSSPVHAGLGATRIARIFELACAVSSPAPPASPTPTYLRHTPLLI